MSQIGIFICRVLLFRLTFLAVLSSNEFNMEKQYGDPCVLFNFICALSSCFWIQ